MKKGKRSVRIPWSSSIQEAASDLIRVAMGDQKATLVVHGGRVVNVYTGEILDGWSIAVHGEKIACIGEDLGHTIGNKTVVINARKKTVIPGLIDGHAHLAWIFSITEFLRKAMVGGTTTLVTETMEPFPVAGLKGVMDFIASTEDQPVKIFVTAPAMGSISKSTQGISQTILKRLLSHPSVVGLGESYWQGVLQNPGKFLPAFLETLRFNKTVEGHTAGARGMKLNAYAAMGPSSCHEPITSQEALERLRLGLWVMIREGSIRHDLAAVSKIKDAGVETRRLILVTDGITPQDLLEKGYMENVVQKAIDCGFNPVTAVQMATLNVAEHFSIDHQVGGIAPGRYADLLIIPDIKTIRPEIVISNGKVIARNGKLLATPRTHVFSDASLHSVHLKRLLSPEDFVVSTRKRGRFADVRVIEQVTELITQEREVSLEVKDGRLVSDLSRDILKVAAIDRTKHPGKMFVGFIKGFYMKSGAFASSAAWDTSDIVVVGADESDMALAVNRIYELQGGAVICSRGKIRAELPLPIFGLINELPLKSLQRKLSLIHKAASALGIPFANPLLTLVILTGASIPFLRICEEGLVHFKDGRKKELIVRLRD